MAAREEEGVEEADDVFEEVLVLEGVGIQCFLTASLTLSALGKCWSKGGRRLSSFESSHVSTSSVEPELELELELELESEFEFDPEFDPEFELEFESESEFELALEFDFEPEVELAPEFDFDFELESELGLEVDFELDLALDFDPVAVLGLDEVLDSVLEVG